MIKEIFRWFDAGMTGHPWKSRRGWYFMGRWIETDDFTPNITLARASQELPWSISLWLNEEIVAAVDNFLFSRAGKVFTTSGVEVASGLWEVYAAAKWNNKYVRVTDTYIGKIDVLEALQTNRVGASLDETRVSITHDWRPWFPVSTDTSKENGTIQVLPFSGNLYISSGKKVQILDTLGVLNDGLKDLPWYIVALTTNAYIWNRITVRLNTWRQMSRDGVTDNPFDTIKWNANINAVWSTNVGDFVMTGDRYTNGELRLSRGIESSVLIPFSKHVKIWPMFDLILDKRMHKNFFAYERNYIYFPICIVDRYPWVDPDDVLGSTPEANNRGICRLNVYTGERNVPYCYKSGDAPYNNTAAYNKVSGIHLLHYHDHKLYVCRNVSEWSTSYIPYIETIFVDDFTQEYSNAGSFSKVGTLITNLIDGWQASQKKKLKSIRAIGDIGEGCIKISCLVDSELELISLYDTPTNAIATTKLKKIIEFGTSSGSIQLDKEMKYLFGKWFDVEFHEMRIVVNLQQAVQWDLPVLHELVIEYEEIEE